MPTYNKQLNSVDDLEVKTYYKNKCGLCHCDVEIISIGETTVNARIGCADALDIKKTEILALINHGFYSLT